MLLAAAPIEVLALVLQHVPLRQRMSSCALVAHSWYQAAAAATTKVSCTDLTPAAAWSLAEQLNSSSWAQHITSLKLGMSNRHPEADRVPMFWMLQMTCPKLQHLDLRHLDLDLFCDGTSVLHGCPALQSLRLQSCSVVDEPHPALSALSAVIGLTRVHIDSLKTFLFEDGRTVSYLADLQPLRNLTCLQELHISDTDNGEAIEELWGKKLDDSTTAPSQQQQEQQQQQGKDMAPLLPHLTCLVLSCDEYGSDESATPLLAQLTGLKSLELNNIGDISCLKALTQLERLVLHSVVAIYAPDLLDALPPLTLLRHLDVSSLGEHKPHTHPRWSALGCCTNLDTLRLQVVFSYTSEWPRLFRGAHLPKLRQLLISAEDNYETDWVVARMPAQCLQDIVTACPNLAVLELSGDGLSHIAPLNAISDLTGLTRLRVVCGGDDRHREEQAAVLAGLRQLQHLHVQGLRDVQLLQLTVLTQLTAFERDNSYCRSYADNDFNEEGLIGLRFQASCGAALVWQQLLQHCKKDPECKLPLKHADTVNELQCTIKQLQQQTQQQEHALAAAAQTIQEQAQQLRQTKQQLQEYEQQRVALQQQLADRDRQLAEQRPW